MVRSRKEQINIFRAYWFSDVFAVAAGDFFTFSALPGLTIHNSVTGTPGGNSNTANLNRGIVTAGDYNIVRIRNYADKSAIITSGNDAIFGRLTYSAPNYRVDFKKYVNGVETSATMPENKTLEILFPEVIDTDEIPPSASLTNEGEWAFGGSPGVGTSSSYSVPVRETVAATVNGQTTFSLTNTPVTTASLLMFVNQLKIDNDDYSLALNTVTYSGSYSIQTTDDVEFYYFTSSIPSTGGSQSLSDVLTYGNITDGYDIELSNGDDLVFADGATAARINVQKSSGSGFAIDYSGAGSATNGGGITLNSQNGSTNGGGITLKSGNGTSGNGGAVTIVSGSGDSSSGSGGGISLVTNSAFNSGNASILTSAGGNSSGNIALLVGSGTNSGGDITLTSGASSAGTAGDVILKPGSGLTIDGAIILRDSDNNDIAVVSTENINAPFEINGDGYVYGDFGITGKLTVDGLIDPTGMVFDKQSSIPGGEPAAGKATLWIRDTDGKLVVSNPGESDKIASPDLQDVLAEGNTSGGENINLDSGGTLIINSMNYPTTDGSPGQVLTTNGAGALSFTSGGGGGGLLPPVNPADDGKLAYGSGGDLAYASNVTVDGSGLLIASDSEIGFEGTLGENLGIDLQGDGLWFNIDYSNSATVNGGSIVLESQTAPSGVAGNILLITGDGVTNAGNILLIAGDNAQGGTIDLKVSNTSKVTVNSTTTTFDNNISMASGNEIGFVGTGVIDAPTSTQIEIAGTPKLTVTNTTTTVDNNILISSGNEIGFEGSGSTGIDLQANGLDFVIDYAGSSTGTSGGSIIIDAQDGSDDAGGQLTLRSGEGNGGSGGGQVSIEAGNGNNSDGGLIRLRPGNINNSNDVSGYLDFEGGTTTINNSLCGNAYLRGGGIGSYSDVTTGDVVISGGSNGAADGLSNNTTAGNVIIHPGMVSGPFDLSALAFSVYPWEYYATGSVFIREQYSPHLPSSPGHDYFSPSVHKYYEFNTSKDFTHYFKGDGYFENQLTVQEDGYFNGPLHLEQQASGPTVEPNSLGLWANQDSELQLTLNDDGYEYTRVVATSDNLVETTSVASTPCTDGNTTEVFRSDAITLTSKRLLFYHVKPPITNSSGSNVGITLRLYVEPADNSLPAVEIDTLTYTHSQVIDHNIPITGFIGNLDTIPGANYLDISLEFYVTCQPTGGDVTVSNVTSEFLNS